MTRAPRCISLVVAACSAARPTAIANAPHDDSPRAELLVIRDRELAFYAVTPERLAQTRVVALPAPFATHAWLGRELVVLVDDRSAYGATVGIVTARGFVALPRPPRATFAAEQPAGAGYERFDPPWWTLATVAPDQIWLGGCEWGTIADGRACDAIVWARLRPQPIVVAHELPTTATDDAIDPPELPRLPTIAPSHAIAVALVPDVTRTCDRPRRVLRCNSIEYPPPDQRGDCTGFGGISEIDWLEADPPLFRVQFEGACLDGMCKVPRFFEGCTESTRFDYSTTTEIGPSELFVLYGRGRSSVRWREHEIGTIDGRATFAPQ